MLLAQREPRYGRYFFNIVDGTDIPDHEGTAFPGVAEARSPPPQAAMGGLINATKGFGGRVCAAKTTARTVTLDALLAGRLV